MKLVKLHVLFLSGLRLCEGYETNDEEKRKKKFKPASVKELSSPLRLLHFGSSGPQDNHLSQVLSNEIDLAPTRTATWLEILHFVPSSCIVCKLVSSRRGLEPFVFSLRYTLGLDLVCKSSWLYQQNSTHKYHSVASSVSYQQAADKRDDESRVWCSTYWKSTPRIPNRITTQLRLPQHRFFLQHENQLPLYRVV